MVYYNIFSITVFTVCLIFIPKVNNYEGLYFIASIEVLCHQVLADYFLGTQTEFHYFILLMGIIPFMVFDRKFKTSGLVSFILTSIFIVYENLNIPSKYEVSEKIIRMICWINISITIFIIVIMLLVFTKIVENVENHITRQNIALEKEINLASVIQQSFFKQDLSFINKWDIAYYNKPMVGVSGDLYDFYKKDGILHGLGIFDVSGHGISSGLVTMLVKNIVFQEFYRGNKKELWEVLNKINDRVIQEKGDIENYLTGILIRIEDNEFEIVNAAHPSPILFRKEDSMGFYLNDEKSKGAIGLPDFPTYFYSEKYKLNSGDFMVLYSDGVTDLKNSDGVTFGKERLMRIVELTNQLSAESQMEKIIKTLDTFRGEEEQNDDITVIVIKKL